MSLYREEAVVLRTHKLGEADRIVVLMTGGRGKVRAVAKGIRKTKSRFGGRLEPPGHVSLLLYEGRNLDVISQAETVDHHRPIREDLDRMTDALALVEAVDQVAQEGETNPPLFKMLTGALRVLGEWDPRPALLVGAFYWKLLALEGVAPVVDGCVRCGAPDTVSFDPVEGGTLCREHRRGTPVEGETLRLIQRILGGQLAAALGEPPGPTVSTVSHLATSTLEAHLERRLRTLHLMREVPGPGLRFTNLA
ncbi:MAG: DNA repair protein RecO [Acidimicrobiales bacterium]|nr:DNA repair protein RecO [Acidimicrobiales bacterium]